MAAEDAMPPTARPDTRLTLDDFMLFPDDGKRHELIDGEHVVTPSPNTRHQRVVQRLYLALGEHLSRHPEQGEAFIAPFDVILSFHDVVEPDLLVIGGDQTEILTSKNVQGPPALVVEVLSESTRKRDEQTKRRLFERAGVREYWLVDPDLDLVKVFRRAEDARLPRVAELTLEERETLTTPLLPGFVLRLDALFPEQR
jgi:Uma2 family endonuclease